MDQTAAFIARRVASLDPVPSVVVVLRRVAVSHARSCGEFEAVAPPHDPWDWYAAAYIDARQAGFTPDEAFIAAARQMAHVKNINASPS